jgi:hypothetical protein
MAAPGHPPPLPPNLGGPSCPFFWRRKCLPTLFAKTFGRRLPASKAMEERDSPFKGGGFHRRPVNACRPTTTRVHDRAPSQTTHRKHGNALTGAKTQRHEEEEIALSYSQSTTDQHVWGGGGGGRGLQCPLIPPLSLTHTHAHTHTHTHTQTVPAQDGGRDGKLGGGKGGDGEHCSRRRPPRVCLLEWRCA